MRKHGTLPNRDSRIATRQHDRKNASRKREEYIKSLENALIVVRKLHDAGLMKACAECLGHDDLRLIKAGLNLKTSTFAVRGGAMKGPHMLESHQTDSGATLAAGEEPHLQEYGQTTLAVPSLDSPEAVVAVIFLNDIKGVGGAMCVVPHTAGMEGWGRSVIAGEDRALPTALYKQERATDYTAGTVLLYRSDTEMSFFLSSKCCFATKHCTSVGQTLICCHGRQVGHVPSRDAGQVRRASTYTERDFQASRCRACPMGQLGDPNGGGTAQLHCGDECLAAQCVADRSPWRQVLDKRHANGGRATLCWYGYASVRGRRCSGRKAVKSPPVSRPWTRLKTQRAQRYGQSNRCSLDSRLSCCASVSVAASSSGGHEDAGYFVLVGCTIMY